MFTGRSWHWRAEFAKWFAFHCTSWSQ
jgi:hypothetical protein